MRFIRYASASGPTLGLVDAEGSITPLDELFQQAIGSRPALAISVDFVELALEDPRLFLASLDLLRPAIDEALDVVNLTDLHLEKIEDVRALPFVDAPEKVIGVSYNYAKFKKEEGIEGAADPQVFAKTPSSLLGAETPVRISTALSQVDYEAEVGVIIGKTARRVSTEQAAGCIGAYAAVNEMTAKILPRPKFDLETVQVKLKAIDNFCPMGSVVVTADEWEALGRDIHVNCKVNGESRQHYPAYDWVHTPAEVIAFVSGFMTLRPGDVIAMGTSSGVGIAAIPPRLLNDGDIVECWIDGIPGTNNVIRFLGAKAQMRESAHP